MTEPRYTPDQLRERADNLADYIRTLQKLNDARMLDSSLAAMLRQGADAKAELARILAVLPEPVWNDRRVLVWSMLDIERVKSKL